MKPVSDNLIQIGNYSLEDVPSYDQLVHCMRCGFCLPTCPTYALTKLEFDSPRGRLALMRAVSEGRAEVTEEFADAMDFCLGCLACQTACPAGVPFGHLIEKARQQVENKKKPKRALPLNLLRNFLVKKLLYDPHGLNLLMPFLRLYQATRIDRLNLARLIPGPLGGWERMFPKIPAKSIHSSLGEFVAANPPVVGRVGLLTGCIENNILSGMGIATADVLKRNGFEIVIPKKQVCCGALSGHIGELEVAREQARRNIDVFEAAGVEIVISDAAGCSAQLKEYGNLLSGDPVYAERANRFSRNARDITEFLCENLPLREGMRPLNLRVAYDDPCHLIHSQGIYLQPRELINSIPGIEFVELPESSWCCGSAGTYNLTHVEAANDLLKRKMEHLSKLDVDVLATANTGCYIQLAYGLKEHQLDLQVCHIIELVSGAYSDHSRWTGTHSTSAAS
jgi:glycolate oxidase iron-sulfur subunit